ncbi:MAG: hypothetical protein LBN27_02955 [Prevotellaceae bacterium]|jgi:hypothetical protein|nr:hypothetical protein [Prevotellaceae bacterium]GHT32702.1 hypothetical protein FACS189434_05120 [Bacteroidia bacterium]
MVVETREITSENIAVLLAQFAPKPKRTLETHFGKLKRGIDGLEYQKKLRNEWD